MPILNKLTNFWVDGSVNKTYRKSKQFIKMPCYAVVSTYLVGAVT